HGRGGALSSGCGRANAHIASTEKALFFRQFVNEEIFANLDEVVSTNLDVQLVAQKEQVTVVEISPYRRLFKVRIHSRERGWHVVLLVGQGGSILPRPSGNVSQVAVARACLTTVSSFLTLRRELCLRQPARRGACSIPSHSSEPVHGCVHR